MSYMDWWFEGSEWLCWISSMVLGSGSMLATSGSADLGRFDPPQGSDGRELWSFDWQLFGHDVPLVTAASSPDLSAR